MRAAAALLKPAIEAQGHRGRAAKRTTARHRRRLAVRERVELKDGRMLPAALVVMAAGSQAARRRWRERRPRRSAAASWSTTSSRPTRRPASTPSASAPSIAAICYGLVEPAYEQAQGAGAPPRRTAGALRGLAAGDQPQGLRRARVLDGRLRGRGRRDHRAARTEGAGSYRKLVLRDDRLPASCCSAIRATRSGIAISSARQRLGGGDPARARVRQGATRRPPEP